MNNKYKFETLEELQQTYPIHSIFSQRTERHIDLHTYYNSNDLKVFRRYSDNVEILDQSFRGMVGRVSGLDMEKGKVTVMLSLFGGRETPIDLDYDQVFKV